MINSHLVSYTEINPNEYLLQFTLDSEITCIITDPTFMESAGDILLHQLNKQEFIKFTKRKEGRIENFNRAYETAVELNAAGENIEEKKKEILEILCTEKKHGKTTTKIENEDEIICLYLTGEYTIRTLSKKFGIYPSKVAQVLTPDHKAQVRQIKTALKKTKVHT